MTLIKYPHPSIYRRGLGAIPSIYDPRDYSMWHPDVIDYFYEKGILYYVDNPYTLPISVDNTNICSPIRDQGHLGSCVSFATVGILEYFENLNYNQYVDASEMFVYKTLLQIEGYSCGSGAHINKAMRELKEKGAPKDECYPYKDSCPLDTMNPECTTEALDYRSNSYVNLEQGISGKQAIIDNIKSNVASKNAVIIGFKVYNGPYNDHGNGKGEFYVPCPNDSVRGGHSVLVIGYNDEKSIVNPTCPSENTTGGFKIKNSWGTDWGLNGYGWLPYQYWFNNNTHDEYTLTGVTMPNVMCPQPNCTFGLS